MRKQDISLSDELETPNQFTLKLFITGASPNSARAIANLKSICENYLTKKYDLEIIDASGKLIGAIHFKQTQLI